MPPRRSQLARRLAARDAITGAAVTVFALRGYEAASMDDVRLAAGCSKGALYHHFSSKQALLEAIIGRLGQAGVLSPPFDQTWCDLPPAGAGRLLIGIWTAAARSPAVAAALCEASGADPQVTGTRSGHSDNSATILAIGTLIANLLADAADDADESKTDTPRAA